jgi:hypothetical protein
LYRVALGYQALSVVQEVPNWLILLRNAL